MPKLAAERYGKSRVRMMKVARANAGDGASHALREVTVAVLLEGDFAAAYTEGSNRSVLPTDTMKNTIYAFGKEHPLDTLESFAAALGGHFVSSQTQVTRARVEVAETAWRRLTVGGSAHPHAFERGSAEQATVVATVERKGETPSMVINSGLTGLVVLKTTDSAFEGFVRDRYTTLADAADRLLATSITADWTYDSEPADYRGCRTAIRTALVETFATHHSRSVQHSLFAMAEAALAACAEIGSIHLVLPNQHCLPVDLSPFGLDNNGEVFLPIDDPAGYIEATIER